METKELIFNGKKFFEGQTPNYIGKTINGLKKGTINPWGINTNPSSEEPELAWLGKVGGGNVNSLAATRFNGKKIYGQVLLKNGSTTDVYVMASVYVSDYWYCVWITVADILQNGGGIS